MHFLKHAISEREDDECGEGEKNLFVFLTYFINVIST